MIFSLACASVSATPTHLKLPSTSRRKISKVRCNALSFLPWGQGGMQATWIGVRVTPMGRFQQLAFQKDRSILDAQTLHRRTPRGSRAMRRRGMIFSLGCASVFSHTHPFHDDKLIVHAGWVLYQPKFEIFRRRRQLQSSDEGVSLVWYCSALNGFVPCETLMVRSTPALHRRSPLELLTVVWLSSAS